jgi:hypothetical protein
MTVTSFTQGKNKDRNEDCFGYNDETFVLADGATDKSGRQYEGKTGGEIISRLVVDETLGCSLNGVELVSHLNQKLAQVYEDLGIMNDVLEPKYRFTCFFVAVRIVGTNFLITYLGDTALRINGDKVYRDPKQIDFEVAQERARYIEETGDIAGSREHIMPLLLAQFTYQNNPEAPLGYGAIDGFSTPDKFVKTLEIPREQIQLIELFSDGYPAIPSGSTIEDWENAFKEAEREDPDRWKKYQSTKPKDDRTVAIVRF